MYDITALYQKRFNIQHATFTKIEHEDAIVATIYLVTFAIGKPLILKICKVPRHYHREVYYLRYFFGKLPVPRIIKTVEPSQDIDGAILMECVPGNTGKITDFNGDLAFELGSLLGRIHKQPVRAYGELIDQKNMKSDPQSFFSIKFAETIFECASHLPVSLIERCQKYYNAHLHLLDSLDGPCMVHRDFRPGNVIVANGKVQGIIDWSSAVAGFAEEDFCCMEHSEWTIDSSGKKSFLEGYRSIRPVPKYESIMPLLRISKALHIIGFLVKSGTWHNEQSRLYQINRQFLEDFFV